MSDYTYSHQPDTPPPAPAARPQQKQARLLLSHLLHCPRHNDMAPRSRQRPHHEPAPPQPHPQPLLGTFAAPIDAAGSVVLPAALHHAHTAWVLTRGDDGCLQMLPPAVWRALAERTCTTPAGAGPAPARTLRRQLFASAAPLKPDSSGAIVIPPNLRAYADLGEQALFVGLYTYIEVWSDDRWQAIVENL